MAFCEQCGNKISDTAKFCGKCGAAVVTGQTEVLAEIPQASRGGDNESLGTEAYNAGMACIEAEQYDGAIAHFTEAIRLHPNPSGAYYKRGQIYGLIIGDHDRAIADYTSALQIANKKEDIYLARGQAYYTKLQYDNAIADFNQAIRLAPNQAEYYSARGKAYACLGDFDTGIADFTKALQIAPDVAETYGCRGAAYLEKGDLEKARADMEHGLSIDPNDETLVELAEVFNEAMSAPGTCAQCGAPLDEDEVFCSNCGAKVGAIPAAPIQNARVQAQRQAESDEVLKEGVFYFSKGIFSSEQGILLLLRDKLEWKGRTNFVIPIEQISSVDLFIGTLDFLITLENTRNYQFGVRYHPEREKIEEKQEMIKSWLMPLTVCVMVRLGNRFWG